MTTERERILPVYTAGVYRDEMFEAIGQALGAASVCWDPMDCTGVFDSRRASQLADELLEIAIQFAHTGDPAENKPA